jgi:IS30 family transposase
VNWTEIIFDLHRAGFSDAEIARKVNVAPTTINGLKNGQWEEPRYSLGSALLSLHERVRAAGLMTKAA